MKKFNILTVAALSMVISLLSGCTGGKKEEEKPVDPPEPEIPDVFEEASYEDYMAALEGKSFHDASYKKCLINGTVKDYAESSVLASFTDEPVRFDDDMSRPRVRPQGYGVNSYAMNYVMGFASYFSEEDENVYYLNKGNKETPYMVKYQEYVAEDVFATTTYVFNADGLTVSVKSAVADISTDPLVHYALDIRPLKDLTFTWQEKDTVDSYERIARDAFIEKATAFEGATLEYQSGHANGTIGYCNSEDVITLENDLLVRGSERFESVKHKYDLIELFHNRASYSPDYDTYYFYYSESLDSLMAIMNMASGDSVIERVMVWNNNGLPTSVKDTTFGNCSTFGSTRLYNVAFSYSNDVATVTLTILSGVGAWADGSTFKTITANVGSYLGNVMSTFTMPTAEGMTIYGSSLARENGQLMNYGEVVTDDMTLIVPFYNNAGSPTIMTFVDAKNIKFDMQGFTSSEPMIVYLTDGSNSGYYFPSGAKQTVEMAFKDTKALAPSKTMYIYGANVAVGDENGLFNLGNANLASLTLNGNSVVGDYAFAHTSVATVSVNAAGISRIGAHAFDGCEELTTLYCGSITEIGDYAFANAGLTGVFTAAKGASIIGEKAFDGCSDLTGILVPTYLTYLETSSTTGDKLNRFPQNQQELPEGWNANWNGDAKILYELTLNDFQHEGAAIDVGGTVGGPNGEETFTFAMYLMSEATYTIRGFVMADDILTVSQLDGTEIINATYEGTGNYDKTATNVAGGQWILIEIHGLVASNTSGYFFRVTQEA